MTVSSFALSLLMDHEGVMRRSDEVFSETTRKGTSAMVCVVVWDANLWRLLGVGRVVQVREAAHVHVRKVLYAVRRVKVFRPLEGPTLGSPGCAASAVMWAVAHATRQPWPVLPSSKVAGTSLSTWKCLFQTLPLHLVRSQSGKYTGLHFCFMNQWKTGDGSGQISCNLINLVQTPPPTTHPTTAQLMTTAAFGSVCQGMKAAAGRAGFCFWLWPFETLLAFRPVSLVSTFHGWTRLGPMGLCGSRSTATAQYHSRLH